MKTFKLCSLAVLFDDDHEKEDLEGKQIPLVDGLIINKEEAKKNWLVEAVVDKNWRRFFEEYAEADQQFMAEVTITKKTNDPATLVCSVKSVNELSEHLSVHLDGVIVAKKDDLSDMLLKNLVKEGFSGEALYEEFKKRKKDRGQAIQGILTTAYEQVKEKGYYEAEKEPENKG
ncbi:YwpF-like family protein [Bacillus sp. H-16]|uniref:YwpF-like family protein n=1 Tax=Alteribacter salitolerans TaxID=2912333 RepID=UPI0019655F82|nr:YwpF-like family protein [Alteribacter salitolerans]MBM7094328.1 YwpF-like family protein [Alteribacter salitolerans]